MLNAQWLETFAALCETGHFTRTADILGMTQPGVSQHLQKLEAQIGQSLISKQGKSFVPTPAGEAVFALGLSRRKEEQVLRETVLHDDPDVGNVVIACSGSFAMLFYPYVLPLMAQAPHLVVRVEATPEYNLVEGVVDGHFDLGIANHEPRHPRLDARYLGQEELCLVLPSDETGTPATFDGLQKRGFITHPDGPAYADALFLVNFPDAYQGSDKLNIRGSVNQISQIALPVAQGIGYTLLPRSGLDAFPEKHRLQTVNLGTRRYQDLWMISRQGRVLPSRVTRLAGLVETVCSDWLSA